MPSTIYPIEYPLDLSTGESVLVSELDPGRVPALSDAAVLEAAAAALTRCARMPRAALEAAKMGHSKHFEELMSTPPLGALMKLERHLCAERHDCAIAGPGCTTRNVVRRGPPGRFPVCWEYEVPDRTDPVVAFAARDLAGCIVLAWRAGRVVVIVEG